MIKALPKFNKYVPEGAIVIDTTSNSGKWAGLSPFIVPAYPAKNLENLWQYSKVYSCHVLPDGNINFPVWFLWRDKGWNNPRAIRYPMGKGTIPICSYWNGELLTYIEARKRIYIPEYSRNVVKTDSFHLLRSLYEGLYEGGGDLILLDYDAYDHKALGMTLKDVVNNPNKKCGHAFVLLSILTEEPML